MTTPDLRSASEAVYNWKQQLDTVYEAEPFPEKAHVRVTVPETEAVLRRLSELERELREARIIAEIVHSRYEASDIDYPEVFEVRLMTFLRSVHDMHLGPQVEAPHAD